MNDQITRRDWLIGGGIAAGTMMTSNIAFGQTFPDAITNPSMQTPIRCGANENVYGPSIKAQQAMDKAAKQAHLYNFRAGGQLKAVIAKMENIPEDHIAAASGSSPFLEKAAYVARMDGGAILAPNPTYNSVMSVGEQIGAEIIRVPVGDDLAINLDAMRAAITDKVKLIYLCNPNNPIPTIIEKNALKDFCIEMSKKAIVLIDEAYYEYADSPDYQTMAELVKDHQNIIVTRTASKIHAMAGIRVGFAFAHPETLKLITAPFDLSMNYMAQMGAIVSYQDTEYQDFIRQKNKQSLDILYNVFDEFGLEYIKSQTNFTFFNAKRPSTEINSFLRENGIMGSRPFRPFTDWVRISTAKPEEMIYVADVLRKAFS
ncbi:pyridoxal phosphate-dependent aminotransferase [Pseudemcibacter aquimaris]|uniref:pyridoxal phosphate-dependent aminotransferase n=1 Tax=Pseudemcibacter aquimaris TaxID=2857064 RepID=UPI00201299DE|nr:histidinol-phosphate transaminase [Pseudemcibacter aquimaris]MCC3860311.1 aminotransferase class I/II-fold pyridoxal phosphate-dependent enzyme [Pseudemcibacter aquimaris]WDU57635.1 aminotransferase class I/II-fold pyridoxal phosphate-dependent enzyme [Pseudemcibacter aquimaris]